VFASFKSSNREIILLNTAAFGLQCSQKMTSEKTDSVKDKMAELQHANPKSEQTPEIVVGLVGAVGTELDRLSNAIEDALLTVQYASSRLRLAKLLGALPKYSSLPTKFLDEYIETHMEAGDDFRLLSKMNHAVALLGVAKIKKERAEAGGKILHHAYILRSLKNPAEAHALRQIYGPSFYLVAAYSPSKDRRDYLARRIAESRTEFPFERFFPKADELMLRDQEEVGTAHGQNTRDTFHRADVFVDMSDQKNLSASIQRFVELLFGNTFHTPRKAEYAMFHAHAAALRSAELGRQVGAAIAKDAGDIIAVGCNEVPKAGGGLYWADDELDNRDFQQGFDASDEQKRNLVAETITILKNAGWLAPAQSDLDIEQLVKQALDPDKPVLPKDCKIRSVIEYGRAVHAEMAALTNAARRGASVEGCTMYVTTFPCHLCARNMVAAGISKVVYVEPYAKSLTAELYPDSIAVDGERRNNDQIAFEPFVGIAPRQYLNLFTMSRRKREDGSVLTFSPKDAKLRYFEDPATYLEKEVRELKILSERMKECGIIQ
jgi:deoxycytidylate deaminase